MSFRKHGVEIVAAIFLTCAVFLLNHNPHGWDHWTTDLGLAWLSPRPTTQDPRIALVQISESTLREFPYTSPIDRDFLARLLSVISDAQPKIIGIDLIFDRPTEPSKDQRLTDVIRSIPQPLVLAAIDESIDDHGFQSSFLAATKRNFGHPYFAGEGGRLVLPEDVVRAIASRGDKRSFSETIASSTKQIKKRPGEIAWLLPPNDPDSSDTFATIPAEALFRGDETADALKALIAGRIVLIGSNFSDRDKHLTPLFLRTAHRATGLEIHAQAIAQLLDGREIIHLSAMLQSLLILVFLIFGIWIAASKRFRHTHVVVGLVELSVMVAIMLMCVLFFALGSAVLPFDYIFLAWTIGVAGGSALRG